MMFRPVSVCLLAAVLAGGCKSEARVTVQPLAPGFAGYWASGDGNSCNNNALRFDKTEIVRKVGSRHVALFRIADAELRGAVAELTLHATLPKAAWSRLNEEQRGRISAFKLHVTLVNEGSHLSVGTIEMDNPAMGRRTALGRDRHKIERLFKVRKCPA